MDEIEKAINGEDGKPAPEIAPENKPTEEEVRISKAQKELADLEAAKSAANTELQRIRKEKREAKKNPAPEPEQEQVIDETDPGAKAWIKRINAEVSPVQEEMEKEKAEIRQFALDEFLESRPVLAKNPDKLKELMQVYDRIHTATERNKEGVLLDLDKAYAAVYHRELLEAAQQRKVGEAKSKALFSDIAVSRGSTAYETPREVTAKLSAEEENILSKWGMTSQEWQKMKEEQDKKAEQAV